MTREQLVEVVKTHAQEHYEDGGWDVLVECYSDAEISEHLEQDAPDATEPEEAIRAFQWLVDVWHERQQDAINSAF